MMMKLSTTTLTVAMATVGQVMVGLIQEMTCITMIKTIMKKIFSLTTKSCLMMEVFHLKTQPYMRMTHLLSSTPNR